MLWNFFRPGVYRPLVLGYRRVGRGHVGKIDGVLNRAHRGSGLPHGQNGQTASGCDLMSFDDNHLQLANRRSWILQFSVSWRSIALFAKANAEKRSGRVGVSPAGWPCAGGTPAPRDRLEACVTAGARRVQSKTGLTQRSPRNDKGNQLPLLRSSASVA